MSEILDTALGVILSCLNVLSSLTLFFIALIISLFLLLGITSILDAESPFLLSQPNKVIKAFLGLETRFGAVVALLTLLNAIVLFSVIGNNIDEQKYFWETFFHAFPVGLIILAFSVVVQSIILGLYCCFTRESPTVDGVEMEALTDARYETGVDSKV